MIESVDTSHNESTTSHRLGVAGNNAHGENYQENPAHNAEKAEAQRRIDAAQRTYDAAQAAYSAAQEACNEARTPEDIVKAHANLSAAQGRLAVALSFLNGLGGMGVGIGASAGISAGGVETGIAESYNEETNELTAEEQHTQAAGYVAASHQNWIAAQQQSQHQCHEPTFSLLIQASMVHVGMPVANHNNGQFAIEALLPVPLKEEYHHLKEVYHKASAQWQAKEDQERVRVRAGEGKDIAVAAVAMKSVTPNQQYVVAGVATVTGLASAAEQTGKEVGAAAYDNAHKAYTLFGMAEGTVSDIAHGKTTHFWSNVAEKTSEALAAVEHKLEISKLHVVGETIHGARVGAVAAAAWFQHEVGVVENGKVVQMAVDKAAEFLEHHGKHLHNDHDAKEVFSAVAAWDKEQAAKLSAAVHTVAHNLAYGGVHGGKDVKTTGHPQQLASAAKPDHAAPAHA